jgi:hypothetical protein
MIAIALIAGGTLLMSGAALPWLTLFAGLHQYGGLMGAYGQAVFAAGAAAVVCGITAVRVRPPWLPFASAASGAVLFVFGVWLYIGMQQIVHRPEAVMFVPSPGPGLYVVLCGAAVLALGPLLLAKPWQYAVKELTTRDS